MGSSARKTSFINFMLGRNNGTKSRNKTRSEELEGLKTLEELEKQNCTLQLGFCLGTG